MARSRMVRVLGFAVLAAALVAPTASADDISESKGFRKAVTLAGIRQHQAAFQAIADANGGNRVAGSAAYDASRDYVVARMEAAGYDVSLHEFDFLFNADATPAVFQQVSPDPATYTDGVDFASMTYSPNGDVTAPVTAVELTLPPSETPNSSTSGCEAADFAGFPAGTIALVQRGTCTFAAKAVNAANAGAAATVVFNEGQPGRTAAVAGTLGGPVPGGPVIGTSFDIGFDLSNGVTNGDTGSVARVRVDRENETRTTYNVIAETPGGDPNRVVIAGAHLDSVTRGPGMNDDGSGAAAILEIAEVYAAQDRTPRNKLRFIWFGAEEFGLLGSEAYVEDLSADEIEDIEVMLNFDMIGSPNYMRGVYDGDGSDSTPAGPPGSAFIEDVFVDYFNSQGLANEPTQFSGRSDYGPFIAAGVDVPAGGLFTGAEAAKTQAQYDMYGGLVGAQLDPCYHLACDTYTGTGSGAGATAPGLGLQALDEMSDAAAHAILFFSRTKVDVAVTEASAARISAFAVDGTVVDEGPHPAHDHEVVAE